MARFTAGQRVKVAFNPPAPDIRVPNQVNGSAPGRGEYQTAPEFGTVVEALLSETGARYLVDVELAITHERNGKPHVIRSVRKRVIAEEKLKAA